MQTAIQANSQQQPRQPVQDDKYSNLNPKPRPQEHSKDPVRAPEETMPHKQPQVGTQASGNDKPETPNTFPQEKPETNPSQFPERHPNEIPVQEPNEAPDQGDL